MYVPFAHMVSPYYSTRALHRYPSTESLDAPDDAKPKRVYPLFDAAPSEASENE
jgi:hypothetical protein